ncbi:MULTISPECIES: hypothetical protein [Pedobacter]|uniref:Uncharacterized protein n=1 Tax=Pedobacter suwonensis TaxID=332999 RepID=A0A1I0TTP6_9SPHI|nr:MULTISPECIES: hypothetical protein [Pedobacter]SFA55164.1 hypothetical protein SAMN04488511_114100 [Pedobacter suwonensis]
MKYDIHSIMSYEIFLLGQYQIVTKGLFYVNGSYFIYCPDITETTLAIDGSKIHEWFRLHKIMGTLIFLVSEIPESSVQIDDQIKQLTSPGTGYLLTRADVGYELKLLIPKIYPDYEILDSMPITVSFLEEVSEDGFSNLRKIFQAAKFQVEINFVNSKMPHVSKPEKESIFRNIQTYRDLKNKLSPVLNKAWEEEEDTWLDKRQKIINASPKEFGPYRPVSLQKRLFRCLIDCSSGFSENIRNYLTMYDQICLVAPHSEYMNQTLVALGLSKKELLELHKLGKLQLLFPKSIDYYDQNFVLELLETKKENVHLSRTVTTMTIMEMKKRNPLLFPPLSIQEKQVLLGAIDKSVPVLTKNKRFADAIRKTISETGNMWIRLPNAMNQQDSIVLSSYGTINLMGPIFELNENRDLKLEFMTAIPAVEMAASTGSVLVPTTVHGYDTTNVSSLIADLYSGTPRADWVLHNKNFTNFTAENILAVSANLPVIELATTFDSVEIQRFRDLVLNISKHQKTHEDVSETVEAYNHFVRQYEKNKNNLSAWNIKGFVIGLIGKAMPGVPMASWLINHALKHIIKISGNAPELIKIVETIEAELQGGIPDAVLLSKMRDKVKKKM